MGISRKLIDAMRPNFERSVTIPSKANDVVLTLQKGKVERIGSDREAIDLGEDFILKKGDIIKSWKPPSAGEATEYGREPLSEITLKIGGVLVQDTLDDCDDDGRTPLMRAFQNTHKETAEQLIQAGANCELEGPSLTGDFEFPAWWSAIEAGRLDLVKLCFGVDSAINLDVQVKFGVAGDHNAYEQTALDYTIMLSEYAPAWKFITIYLEGKGAKTGKQIAVQLQKDATAAKQDAKAVEAAANKRVDEATNREAAANKAVTQADRKREEAEIEREREKESTAFCEDRRQEIEEQRRWLSVAIVLLVITGGGLFHMWNDKRRKEARKSTAEAERTGALKRLAAIGNSGLSDSLAELQEQALRILFEAGLGAGSYNYSTLRWKLQAINDRMRAVAAAMQVTEISNLQSVNAHYISDPKRWALVQQMKSTAATSRPAQLIRPKQWLSADKDSLEPIDGNNSLGYLRFAACAAAWSLGTLKTSLERIVSDFNSMSVSELVAEYSLPIEFDHFEFDPNKYLMIPDTKVDVFGPIVKLKLGPLKTAQRAEAKTRAMKEELTEEELLEMEEPLAVHVLDFLRATCAFEDPFALRLFFETLGTVFQIIRVKNKYSEPPSEETGSPSVLINIGIPTPEGIYIAEVQLILQLYLDAKTVQHKSYEVLRSNDVLDLLDAPLWKNRARFSEAAKEDPGSPRSGPCR